jgi:hypothetical protein
MLTEEDIVPLDALVEVLHGRLVKLHEELDIEPWIDLEPVPSVNPGWQPRGWLLMCPGLGVRFSTGTLIAVGETPLVAYTGMLALAHCELERFIRNKQRDIDTAVRGLRHLLRAHD